MKHLRWSFLRKQLTAFKKLLATFTKSFILVFWQGFECTSGKCLRKYFERFTWTYLYVISWVFSVCCFYYCSRLYTHQFICRRVNSQSHKWTNTTFISFDKRYLKTGRNEKRLYFCFPIFYVDVLVKMKYYKITGENIYNKTYHFCKHEIIIQAGIVCKEIPCCMRD